MTASIQLHARQALCALGCCWRRHVAVAGVDLTWPACWGRPHLARLLLPVVDLPPRVHMPACHLTRPHARMSLVLQAYAKLLAACPAPAAGTPVILMSDSCVIPAVRLLCHTSCHTLVLLSSIFPSASFFLSQCVFFSFLQLHHQTSITKRQCSRALAHARTHTHTHTHTYKRRADTRRG